MVTKFRENNVSSSHYLPMLVPSRIGARIQMQEGNNDVVILSNSLYRF